LAAESEARALYFPNGHHEKGGNRKGYNAIGDRPKNNRVQNLAQCAEQTPFTFVVAVRET
jgi:hypothetical protein